MNFKDTLLASTYLVLSTYLLSTTAFAFYAGQVGYSGNPATNGGKNCNNCHQAAIPGVPRVAPDVTLTGPQNVVTGSTNHYVLTMTGGQKKGAGFNVSVQNGMLVDPTDPTMQLKNFISILPDELTHVSGRIVGKDSLGTYTWEFDWQAPAEVGTVNMYAAALSTSTGDREVGDQATSVSLAINVDLTAPEPTPPVAVIDAVKSANINTTVIFSASKSTDADGNISDYSWDFGDSNPVITETTNYTFDALGTHTVKLTVADNSGNLNSTFVDILIVDTANGDDLVPVAAITLPTSAETGQSLQFDAAQSTANNNTATYLWDFGDNSTLDHTTAPDTAISHTYSAPGTYTVSLAVQNGTLTGITSVELKVIDPATQPPVQNTGATIYTAQCESCHGVAGAGLSTPSGAKKIIGATALLIEDAIATVVPTMSTISLQAGDSQLLAGFLSSGAGTTGDTIFRTKCELCHGVAGVGGTAKNIENAKQAMIISAVDQTSKPPIPLMQGIVLSAAEATLIETLLTTATGPVETGQTLYDQHCKICHGPAGTGGSAKLIVNASLNMVDTAITAIPEMSGVPAITGLTPAQRQKIVDYLKKPTGGGGGGTLPGDPVAGEKTFIAKCQMCHGTGTGGMAIGILNASVTMIETAIINIPKMQPITVSAAEKDNLVALLAKGPIKKPTTGAGLFKMYCSYCHGADGRGASAASIKTKGVTARSIQGAYTGGEPEMTKSNLKNAGLTLSDRTAIANWLK